MLSQTLVEVVSTVRRSVGLDVDFVDDACAVAVGCYQRVVELGHSVGIQFRRANVCLIDKELDISGVFFVDDTLEGVFTEGGINGCRVGESCSGDDAVGYIDTRQNILFLALSNDEVKSECTLGHLGGISVSSGDGDGSTILVGYYGVVATYLFALEGVRYGSGFLAVVNKHGGNRNNGVLNEELSGNVTRDGCGNFFTDNFQRIGVDVEIVLAELAELFATGGQHKYCAEG